MKVSKIFRRIYEETGSEKASRAAKRAALLEGLQEREPSMEREHIEMLLGKRRRRKPRRAA